jgi:uncharacterized membrane protein
LSGCFRLKLGAGSSRGRPFDARDASAGYRAGAGDAGDAAGLPVILIGVIGGMLADGLLGLFLGPVLLAVGYVLLIEWLRQHPVEGEPQIDGSAP